MRNIDAKKGGGDSEDQYPEIAGSIDSFDRYLSKIISKTSHRES